MRERVVALVGPRARNMWVSTFHSTCVRILRNQASLLPGLNSNFSIYDADDSRRLLLMIGGTWAWTSSGTRRGCWQCDLQPQERADRPRTGARRADPGVRRSGPHRGRCLRRVPAPASRGQRAGLRRPDRGDGRGAAELPADRAVLPQALPARPGRRVPGHQPRAVRPGPRTRRARRHRRRPGGAQRVVRGGRRRPVDLRVPRRDDPQHRGFRARLPQRDHDPARAELPVHPEHPVRGQLGDLPQQRPAGETAVDRRRRRGVDRRLRRRQRTRRGPVRRRGDRRAGRPWRDQLQRRRGVLPDQQLVARPGGGLHPGRHPVQGRRRRSVLRAQGDSRHRRLSAGAGQSRRRGQPTAHPEHPRRGIGDRAEACVAVYAENTGSTSSPTR